LALLLLMGCGNDEAAPPAPSAPCVLLATLDTTRADRIGAYGHREAVTPTIDRLARNGVLFEAALSPAPITLPAHASILTGTYPHAHGIRDNGAFELGSEATLVSEVFGRHDWRTAAFVGSYVLDARFGLDQGFEAYRGPPVAQLGTAYYIERRADAVVDDAIEWLSRIERSQPFFAWVHFNDPHAPYSPPPAWAGRLDDRYDEEIAFADEQLGRLLDFLDEAGRGQHLLTLVTADHGEALGEHGEPDHGVFIYQATMHVPLVISGEGVARSRGERIARRVSTADIAPTLLALAGLSAGELPDAGGAPLLEPGGGQPTQHGDRALYLESYLPYHSHRWRAIRGVVHEDYKLIEGRPPELYDLAADPPEERSLAASRPGVVDAMAARLRALVDEHPPLGWAGDRALDGGELQRLAMLGYAAPSVGDDPFDPALPSAVERIGDLALISRATHGLLSWRRFPPQMHEREEVRGILLRAREMLHEVQRHNPRDPQIPVTLGPIEAGLGHFDAAIPLLEEAMRLRPHEPVLPFNLAYVYDQMGQSRDAVRELERAIALDPRNPEFRYRLASLLIAEGELAEAARHLDELESAAVEGAPGYGRTMGWVAEGRARLAAQRRGGTTANPR
jgi:arylsulfatase A-like enzyme